MNPTEVGFCMSMIVLDGMIKFSIKRYFPPPLWAMGVGEREAFPCNSVCMRLPQLGVISKQASFSCPTNFFFWC